LGKTAKEAFEIEILVYHVLHVFEDVKSLPKTVKAANCKVVLMLHLLHSKGIKTVPHPPYSPDIAPCDLYLYPQVKKVINEQRFEVQIDAVKALAMIL
jgi:hypothetical protein